jgi:hypothetical protein
MPLPTPRHRIRPVAAACALLLWTVHGIASPGSAGNLIVNPGFDTCDFSGWTVGGLAASGVASDSTPITGTIIANNVVNAHGGTCAAWAKVATGLGQFLVLEQTVNVAPNTTYEVSFWNGLGGDSNAGRSAMITVGGTTLFNGTYLGVIGTSSGDYVRVTALYTSGPVGGPVTVSFTLKGSGTGVAGLSYDDFSFAPRSNLLLNPGFDSCDFTGWTVGGLAVSGVDPDGTPISGTAVPDNEVNVRSGPCAAWAKVSNTSGIHFTLEQTVDVLPHTTYVASFWNGLSGDLNVGRSAEISVGGTTIFDGFYIGVLGSSPSDFVQVTATYRSGAVGGPVTVRFTLKGGFAGLSYDDFSFAPAENLLANPGFEGCDFAGWTVGGLAVSGVDVDDTAITGTIVPNNVVNVHGGTCAAWASVANGSGIHLTLQQTVVVAPHTVYRVGFWNGLGGDTNVGRSATITVGATTVFDGIYLGVTGTAPSDHVQVAAPYTSGASGGPMLVTFTLRGSGTGKAGLSYDDLEFTPLGPTTALAAGDPPAPRLVQLGRARPNPFRVETVIPYETRSDGVVRLDVYDLRGARVRRLVDGRFAAGHHRAQWDGADDRGRALPAGVYFVRLSAPGGDARARIVLSP